MHNKFFTYSPLRMLLILMLMAAALSSPGQLVSAQPLLADFSGCEFVTGVDILECEALVALYTDTGGTSWSVKTGWLQTDTPCSWSGVSCTAGHVSSLSLMNNQLSGPIPAELNELSGLLYLYLGFNQLSGSIPGELGSLINLKHLFLDSNQLSGAIPAELGSLTNLTALYLHYNQLTGEFPTSITNLTNVINLKFDTCTGLGSTDPVVITFLNSKSAGWNNCLPSSISGNAGAGGASLSYTDGTLKTAAADADGDYSFTVPYFWSGTVTPSKVSFDFTPENKTYTRVIEDQSAQDYTAVYNCANVTEVPLAECLALAALYTDTGGTSWSVKTGWLQTNTPCTWHGISCEADQVLSISLPTNQLSGTIPPELVDLTKLQTLNLSANQLTGSIPPQLGELTDLTALNLGSNQLRGTIPPVLGDLTGLVELNLGSNRLTGSIPPGLANLTKLETLNLSSNQLTGTIPAYLGNLTGLTELNLGSNHLTGSIPLNLTHLVDLENLNLYANQLTGTIPPEVGTLTDLTKLSLGINKLTGTIPPELGSLTKLTLLQLQSNQLSGVIPASITDLTALTTLRFDFCNGLGSSDPEVIAFLNDKADGWNACDSLIISGNAGTGSASLSYTDGTLKTAAADADGDYSFTVPYFWSGTVTPDKLDFYFTPVSKTYTRVIADQTAQNYTASTTTFTISGNAGVGNAILSYTDGTLKTANADADGNYSFQISDNWSGTVTPSKAGYTFAPINKSYTDVMADQTAQNYTATVATYTISGNAGTGDAILSYTDGTLKTAAADANGDYSFQVPYNWSGTVTPSKLGYGFTPAQKTYTQVVADQTGQNFTARTIITVSSDAVQDGWVLESNEASKIGGTLNTIAATLRLGDDILKKQYRSILSFNTSDLPDNAVITSVMLKVKKHSITGGGDPLTTFQGLMVDIKKGTFGPAVLQTMDFQLTANKSIGPVSPAPASGWYAINLTSGKASINKLADSSGLTQIRLRFNLDDDNNSIANTLNLYSGDAPAESRPQLVIQYYVP